MLQAHGTPHTERSTLCRIPQRRLTSQILEDSQDKLAGDVVGHSGSA